MAKLTDKSALITPANDDLLYIVDVSDTTDSGQGTSKKIEFQNLVPVISYPSLLSKPSLGSLAPLDYLSYDALVSKPSLGSLAPLDYLSYDALVSKPSLGSLAPLDYLSFDSLVSKPSLGSLAPLNELSYSALVSKPSLGSLSVLDSIGLINLNDISITSLASGQAILANASGIWTNQTISLDSAPMTFRNILINGNMSVAQRGTSTASITANGYYTADRWVISINFGTVTQSVENDAPTGTGLRKSLKNTFTTGKATLAAGDFFLVRQLIEGQNVQNVLKGTASAKQLTVSFWVKASVTGTYITELFDNDNTRQVSASYSISASNTWEKKTITFPADTTGAFDNDVLPSLIMQFYVAAGTNYTSGTLNTTWASVTTANRAVGQVNGAASNNNFFQITGVQLEAADEASEFEKVPYDINLQRCLRYFWALPNTGDNSNGPMGQMFSTTECRLAVKFPVIMRTTPTASNIGTGLTVFGTNVSHTGTFAVGLYNANSAFYGYSSITPTGNLYQMVIATGGGWFSAEL